MKMGLSGLAATFLISGATFAHAGVLTASDITDPSTQFFDPQTHHIYQVVNSLATWTEAFNAAGTQSIAGEHGYLVTITSESENNFVFNLVKNNITTGWDFMSSWIGLNDLAVHGNWQWVDGPEIGTQIWQGYGGGNPIPGTYNNFIIGDFNDPNSACAGSGSGCWTNPTGTGAQFAFINGSVWRPAGWGIAYSSLTATTTASSPIAGDEGMRNAYIIEYGTNLNVVPEPSTWIMLIAGFLAIGLVTRRKLADPIHTRPVTMDIRFL
jgi:hypothetical protein